MSIGFQVAVDTAAFFDILDREEASLAAAVADAPDHASVASAMEAARSRLSQAVDSAIRSLPAVLRTDLNAARDIAYGLVGVVDGRMLYRPAGGLSQWRERLLESELYGSAIAGDEIIARARRASQAGPDSDAGLLAPFYLALLRDGFQGALRDDASALTVLNASLEEAVGVRREAPLQVAPDARPRRLSVAPAPLAGLGIGAWLAAGFAVWLTLAGAPLADSDRMAERVQAGMPATSVAAPLDRSIGPSGLRAPDLDETPPD